MALEVLIILGLGYLIHVKLVNHMRASRPTVMVVVIVVALVEETMRLTPGTNRSPGISGTSALKEEVAIPVLVLNLGPSIIMVQHVDIQDTRLMILQTLDNVTMVTEPHYHLDVVSCLQVNLPPHILHSPVLALVMTEAGKTLAHKFAMMDTMEMIALGARIVARATADDAILQGVAISRI